jgi:dienelactone hydrolase
MSFRNLSPQSMFEHMALEHTPQYHFKGRTRLAFRQWKKGAYPKVMATLGDLPPRVPPHPQLLAAWTHDGLVKQRWLIDVGPHIAATFQINYPGRLKKNEKRPTLLCWHGHGPYGKDAVMGNDGGADMQTFIAQHNHNYGHRMAKQGFITYAIDWLGIGDRNDNRKPNHRNQNVVAVAPGEPVMMRDWCNLYYLHATMLGMTPLGINVTHGMVATDFALTLPHVDRDRLGVMGLSGGGTMTLWTYLMDQRFKAGEIMCYSDLWAHFGIRDVNYCGSQVTPGLYKLVDLPDLQGLLAPKPLLVDIGAYDSCFLVDTAMACYRQVEKIYRAADARDRLELDFFPGEHAWGGNRTEAFFRKHLG